MSTINSLPTERLALVGVVDPDAYAANTYTTGYIEMKLFARFLAVILVGDIVSTGVVNAKLIAYTDGSGGGAFDIPGAAITAMTEAGTDSNKQALINFDTANLAGSTKYTHFRLSVAATVAGADLAAVVFGLDPKYGPASDNDASTVDSISVA